MTSPQPDRRLPPSSIHRMPMNVISHTMLARHLEEGCSSRTVADAALCGTPFRIDTSSIEPGAASADMARPQLRVVVVIAGSGKLIVDGGPLRFHAPCTVCVPAGAFHRFINDGSVVLQLVSVYMPEAAPEGTLP